MRCCECELNAIAHARSILLLLMKNEDAALLNEKAKRKVLGVFYSRHLKSALRGWYPSCTSWFMVAFSARADEDDKPEEDLDEEGYPEGSDDEDDAWTEEEEGLW
ncbi:hypothetical protein MUP77_01440 [Candidatus Bathyarchaeota archaeon]|nr:hypothetical protein [Candidatus Bathyarchaeota archaeon]